MKGFWARLTCMIFEHKWGQPVYNELPIVLGAPLLVRTDYVCSRCNKNHSEYLDNIPSVIDYLLHKEKEGRV